MHIKIWAPMASPASLRDHLCIVFYHMFYVYKIVMIYQCLDQDIYSRVFFSNI